MKLYKSLIKILLIFFVVQAIIFGFFYVSFKNNGSVIRKQDLKENTIKVDKIEESYKIGNRRMIAIISDYENYAFPKIPVGHTNEYSMYELSKCLNKGDTLVIKYIEQNESNLILEASLNEKQLRTLEGYNDFIKSNQRMIICVFSFIELIFLSVLTIGFIVVIQDIRFTKLKNKKRR